MWPAGEGCEVHACMLCLGNFKETGHLEGLHIRGNRRLI